MLNHFQLSTWNREVFKKGPDCSSAGDGCSSEGFAPLHEHGSLSSLNTRARAHAHTHYLLPGDGNGCFKLLYKEKEKKERRDSAPAGRVLGLHIVSVNAGKEGNYRDCWVGGVRGQESVSSDKTTRITEGVV